MIIADLHIHWRFSRGCSSKLTIPNIWKMAIVKWIDLIWTWDFTHPKRFFEEIKNYLEEENWFLKPKDKYLNKWFEELKAEYPINNLIENKIKTWEYPRFVIQTEINTVFERKWKKHKVHHVILIDSLDKAKQILNWLSQWGKVESDWRLTVKKDQDDILYELKKQYLSSIFIPAHIWTPYFGLLGSKFWFDSIKTAFPKSYMLIDAVETWLSSDPIMNWINSEIDPFVIISNSDAHSLENMAREWNVFEGWTIKDFTYKDLEKILKFRKYRYFNEYLLDFEKKYLNDLYTNSSKFYLDYTIEFYPQEGKYFWDWHSKCEVSFTPEETIKRNWKCPICWKDITIWVFHRTYKLGDGDRKQKINFWTKYKRSHEEIKQIASIFSRPYYKYIVPMRDIIYEVWWYKKWTKSSQKIYNTLIQTFGPEFYILLNLPLEEAYKFNEKFWNALEKVRKWDINIKSWYDGIYWVVKIFEDFEKNDLNAEKYKQNTLF